jgi:hypothetical protein
MVGDEPVKAIELGLTVKFTTAASACCPEKAATVTPTASIKPRKTIFKTITNSLSRTLQPLHPCKKKVSSSTSSESVIYH